VGALLKVAGAQPLKRPQMPSATPPPAVYSTPSPAPDASRAELDAWAAYESQYGDLVFGADARYDLSVRGSVLPYANVIFDYDTRSVPALSAIYNQNDVIPSAGLRAPLGEDRYAELFLQGGYSFGLRGEPSFAESRYGFDYQRDYGTSFASASPHAQLNAYLIDYSRFAGNVIGDFDAFGDARLTPSLRALAGAGFSFDGHREYGNNYAEAYVGLLIPLSHVLDLRLAGVQGTYLARGAGRPAPASYSTFRITLLHQSPR